MDRRQFVSSLGTGLILSVLPTTELNSNVPNATNSALGLNVPARKSPREHVTTPFMTLDVDSDSGEWTCTSQSGKTLLQRATSSILTSVGALSANDAGLRRTASALSFSDALGTGKQLTLSITSELSKLAWRIEIRAYNEFSGLRIDQQLQNLSSQTMRLERLIPLDVQLPVVGYISENHVLINGLGSSNISHLVTLSPAEVTRSYDWIAIESSKSVAGFLSGKETHAMWEYQLSPSSRPLLEAFADFLVPVEPGHSRQTDPALILFPDDLFEGLEDYASAVERFNDVHPMREAGTVWCSWYSGYGQNDWHNSDQIETGVLENARRIEPLLPYGVNTVRVVDATLTQRYGDWNFPSIPDGIGGLASRLQSMGVKPGLWLAPPLVTEASEVFKAHPDWLQRWSNGQLIAQKGFNGWLMHYFDASHPEVLGYLRRLFTYIRSCGYKYVMLDALGGFSVSDRFYDPYMTRAEVYRRALSLIRETLGPDIYILACGESQLPSLGLVDGMRISADAWGEIGYSNIAARYFEAGRWWLNDPDALVGNARPIEDYRAWVTLAAMSGSVVTIGDDLGTLSNEKRDILKRILPARGRVGRPLDLFQSNPSNVWFLQTELSTGKSGVLSLFNWIGHEVGPNEPKGCMGCLGYPPFSWIGGTLLDHRVKPAEILGTQGKTLLYDFWNEYLLDEIDGEMTVSVAPNTVRTLCISERTGDPQVLAVSSHLPQTSWALDRITWSNTDRSLQGKTTAVQGAEYRIALYVPDDYSPQECRIEDKSSFLTQQQQNVWVMSLTGTGEAVRWSVIFS